MKLETPRFSLCVYCGSQAGNDPAFADIAQEVGTWIGRHQGQLVYGGGRHGLMGILADAALTAGGRVLGVIPRSLVDKEWAHSTCTELHIVDSMHERKRLMAEHADAFLALPGGIGTLEEFFEAWTWRQLGYHDKPIGLLNPNGYYDKLLGFLKESVDGGLLGGWVMDLIRTDQNASALIKHLLQAAQLSAPVTRLDQI